MAKQSVGVRERTPGNYEINFRPYKGAASIFRNIQASSIREASMERAKLMLEAQQNTSPINNNGQSVMDRGQAAFHEIWPILEENLKKDDVTHKTLLGVEKVYNRMFVDFVAIKYRNVASPSQLTHSFFQEYQGYYKVTLNRPNGLRAETQRLKMIMHRLRNLGFVSKDLMEDLKMVPTPKGRKKNYPEVTATEMKAFMMAIRQERPDLYGPVYFMLRTGRRIEEVTLIKRSDIVWDGFNPVRINILAENTKTNTEAPLTYLDPELQVHIRHYYQISNKHQAPQLFLNDRFGKTNQARVTEYLGNLSETKLKKRITSHFFRHHLCTVAGNAQLPIADIQAITGIRDTNILVKYYSHSTHEGQRNVMEKTRL